MSSPPTGPGSAPVQRIGRYETLHALGQGGMGRVLLARDTVLGRLVALKVVRDDLGLPPEQRLELFDRMRHEARAAAALSHPNMVTLHDMGEEPSCGLFLVFEYVDGPTLRDRLSPPGSTLSTEEVARLARQLGDALTHAHEAGVIHRDVKPENILLAATGPKLADFGIARLPDSTLTRAGLVLGTPAYSAPEALALGAFSPASDQFSLAATLYEALRGVRAFPGDDAATVAMRVGSEDPPLLPPSTTFDARGAGAVLARAMNKEPQMRFGSCREFGETLAAALERHPSVPPLPADGPMSSVTRSSISLVPRSTLRRQNVAAGTAALVIIGLLAFGGRRDVSMSARGISLKRVSASFASAIARPAVRTRASLEPARAAATTAPPASARRVETRAAVADAGTPEEDADRTDRTDAATAGADGAR